MAISIARRKFMAALGGAAVAWPVAARAQQPMQTVGFLHGGSEASFGQQAAAFRDGLRKAGFVVGQNVSIEYRWADGRFDQLPVLADELVHRQVNVIAAVGGDIVAKAAMAATSTIPIVFMVGQDTVRTHLVASLNRPGGNVTGVTLFVPDLVPKQMELIHTIAASAAVIAVLMNPKNPTVLPDPADLEQSARANGMQLALLNASTPEEIDAAFAAATAQHAGALLVPGDVFFTSRRGQIIALAAKYALPTIYPFRESVAAGGLISYGNDLNETARLAGGYAARVLAGAKPSDLPVQQPIKFELTINLKTAKTLGITVPQSLLVAADEVIE
jgi:putative tryptophan/tyrosine transport system substrate-binding protein